MVDFRVGGNDWVWCLVRLVVQDTKGEFPEQTGSVPILEYPQAIIERYLR